MSAAFPPPPPRPERNADGRLEIVLDNERLIQDDAGQWVPAAPLGGSQPDPVGEGNRAPMPRPGYTPDGRFYHDGSRWLEVGRDIPPPPREEVTSPAEQPPLPEDPAPLTPAPDRTPSVRADQAPAADAPEWAVPPEPAPSTEPEADAVDQGMEVERASLWSRARSWWERGKTKEPGAPQLSPAARKEQRRQRTWRTLLASTVGVIFLSGALNVGAFVVSHVQSLVAPSHRVVSTQPGPPAAAFPEQAAKGFALRFALAYLSYDQDHPELRAAALAPYLGQSPASASANWNGRGKQQVLQAFPDSIQIQGARAVVMVDAYVSTGRWVYLAVPVVHDRGTLSLAGDPAIVAPPRVTPASPPASSADTAVDVPLSQQLKESVSNFFAAWASNDNNKLAYYSAPGAGASFPDLGGQVQFVSLDDLAVAQTTGSSRGAVAKVTWEDPVTHARFTQPYRLTLVYSADRWLVQRVDATAGGQSLPSKGGT